MERLETKVRNRAEVNSAESLHSPRGGKQSLHQGRQSLHQGREAVLPPGEAVPSPSTRGCQWRAPPGGGEAGTSPNTSGGSDEPLMGSASGAGRQ